MEISKTLRPGDMGTKRLLTEYGDNLLCVRYRIDKQQQKRYTTVEIVVDERPYISQSPLVMVWVTIGYKEEDLRIKVKSAGAKWLPDNKVWEMELEVAGKLGLKKRIVKRMVKGYR